MSKETREKAETIVHAAVKRRVADGSVVGQPWALIDAIDQALQAERERAAGIAKSEVEHAAQLLTERGDEGRDILNYTDFIKGQKTAAQDILAGIREGKPQE
jgi:hypothetical protein